MKSLNDLSYFENDIALGLQTLHPCVITLQTSKPSWEYRILREDNIAQPDSVFMCLMLGNILAITLARVCIDPISTVLTVSKTQNLAGQTYSASLAQLTSFAKNADAAHDDLSPSLRIPRSNHTK